MAFCFDEANPTRPASPETWLTYFYRVGWLLLPLLPFFWNTYSMAQNPYAVFSADVLADPEVHEEMDGQWYEVSVDTRDEVLQSIDRAHTRDTKASKFLRSITYFLGGFVAPDSFLNFIPSFVLERQGRLVPINATRSLRPRPTT
jgi:hypothetical protein